MNIELLTKIATQLKTMREEYEEIIQQSIKENR